MLGLAQGARPYLRDRLWQQREDVARIGGMRQGAQPGGDLVGALPVDMDQRMALAEHGIEAPIAEGGAMLDARQGHLALDRGELERQRGYRLCQAGKRLGLEAFDVDLD